MKQKKIYQLVCVEPDTLRIVSLDDCFYATRRLACQRVIELESFGYKPFIKAHTLNY